MDKKKIDELKADVGLARKRELNFGLCLGKTPETTLLMCHKSKAAEALGRIVKKEGETNKFTCGTMAVDGRDLTLKLVSDMPAGLQRKARDMFKAAGLPMNIIIVLPDGATATDDEDADEADEAATQPASQAQEPAAQPAAAAEASSADAADPNQDEWTQEQLRIGTLVAAFVKEGGKYAKAIEALWQQTLKTGEENPTEGLKKAAEAETKLSAAREKQKAEDSSADAAKWTEASGKIARHVEEAITKGTALSKKIEAVWALAQQKAQGANPDFATALKTLPMLVKLIRENANAAPAAKAQPQAQPAAEASAGDEAPQREEVLEEALAGDPEPAAPAAAPPAADAAPGDGTATPAPGVGAAEADADVGDPDDALVADLALSDPPPAVSADLSGDDAAKLKRVEAELTEIDKLVTAYMAILSGSGEVTPAAWTTESGRIKTAMTEMKDGTKPVETAKLDQLLKDVAKLVNEINTKTTLKKDYAKALELFEVELMTLEHHKQATEPEIAPKVTDIKTKRDAAKTKALAQDFKGAIAGLKPLPALCGEVEKLADGCAHYKAVLASRVAREAHSSALAAINVASIDAMAGQITTLLNDAATDAAADKYDDAVKKLDKIPPIYIEMLALRSKKRSYDTRLGDLNALFTSIDGLTADDRALMEPELAAFRKVFADNKVEKTGDYRVSCDQFGLQKMKEYRYFLPLVKAIPDYLKELNAFKTNLESLKTHKGRAGVEEYYLEMDGTLVKAENEAKLKRFTVATALMQVLSKQWTTMKKRADDCESYTTKLAALKLVLDPLRSKAGAEDALKQADAILATAAKQAVSRDYAGALLNIAEAKKRAAEAKSAADATEAMGKLKDDKALDGIDANFAKAEKVFTDMRAHLAGIDTTGAFATEIAKTDTPAAAANTAATKSPPDFGAARTSLDSAIAILEGLLPKVIAFGPFQTHLADAKQLVDTDLPAANDDDCIKAHITEAKALVTKAETLAAAPGLDIIGAEEKLTEARVITDAATDAAARYVQVKADIATIKGTKAHVNQPANVAIAPFMRETVKRLNQYLTDIQTDINAKNMREAAKKSAAGAALDGPIRAEVTSGLLAVDRKNRWYDQELPNVEGKKVAGVEVCKEKVEEAKKLLELFTKHMSDPNFAAATESIKPPAIKLIAAKNQLKSAQEFETKRAAAKTELDKADSVRNAAIEADLTALEARYAKALELGPKHDNYHRACIEADEITAACPPLVTRATGFAPFDAARAPAKAKIDEAKSHDEANAIQTMINRLDAKFVAAEKAAAAEDYDTGKKMMEEIVTDAERAIESADDAANFQIITGTLDTLADTDVFPSAVIFGTQKVVDKLAARPEADAAKADLATANAELAKASAGGGGAKAALKAAIAACEAADEKMSQYRMLEQSVTRATARITALKAHAQSAYISPVLTPVETEVAKVLTDAKASGDHIAEATKLDGHIARLIEIEALADGYGKYLTTRTDAAVEPYVEVLEKHEHSYAIRPNIEAMHAKLDEAAKKAEEHKIEDALTLLEEVRALGVSARVLADMRKNDPPSTDDVKAILARPGGDAELDAIIDQLEPDAQRAVLRVAFEARFGCTLKNMRKGLNPGDPDFDQADGTLAGPEIKRFYQLMSDLPKSHTTENDNLLIFNSSNASGSAFGGKRITMNEGQDEFSGTYGFGRDFEVGGQDEECKPVDMEPVNRFSWNTLHEVGHAVDDKHGYMDKNQGKDDHGGWTIYDRDVGIPAKVFADKFGYDQGYIEVLMMSSSVPAAAEKPATETCSDEEWEQRRAKVTAHVALARKATAPWNSNSQAERIEIDGVVYQESYDSRWMSYKLKARKQGMTGYQFRAPGEWFSELYAAYHVGKMKPSHPAATWLATL
ncbi:hypothetical protein AB2B41_11485 [Marimonas sp. MJW-29]|uniref:Uncharacterized protein n=1 Tax=Sulfitobacter sediminis TaxID=3234186 RepID=A0ABV3RMM4_9RHOB